jgi:hypothetical protein
MVCRSFTVVPRGAHSRCRDRDTNGCYANDDQLQAVTHIMTHRCEYFAGKTESSVAVNAEADTTAGGWAIVYEQMALVGRWRKRDGVPALYWTE